MRVHHWLAGVAACVVPCLPAVCHAESAPYTHDGFYLQMSLGGGYVRASTSADGVDETISGGAIAGSLWIGGSLVPGFALGGGTLGVIAPSPSYKLTIGGQSQTGALGDNSMQLQMLGLVADWYPNPTKGLHFQALVGYAGLSFGASDGSTSETASGLGLMGGVGYDFWVSTEWSIGVLGRLAYAAPKRDELSFSVVSPALLASFTYN
jgi:hypothetical protein